MAFTLDTTYTLYIENPEAAGTTLRVGNAGYSVERVEAEDGTRTFNISSLDGTLLYSGVKRIGLDQYEGKIVGMASWECRKVEVLETGYVTKIAAKHSSEGNDTIESFIDVKGTIKNLVYTQGGNSNHFSSFRKLNHVVLPGIKVIPNNAFAGCVSLEAFVVAPNCTLIGENAFSGCPIKDFTITNGVGTVCIGERYGYANSFERCGPTSGINERNGVLRRLFVYKNYTCPQQKNYSSIGALGYHSPTLRSIVFGESCTNIIDDTCDYATNLATLQIGEGVVSIGSRCFYGCESLRDFVMPKSVTEIGGLAFAYCTCCITCTSAQAAMLTEFAKTGTFNIVDD